LTSHDFSVSLGHDEPLLKHTYGTNEQGTTEVTGTLGVTGIIPTFTGSLGKSKVDDTMTQAAEDTVSPKWDVRVYYSIDAFLRLRRIG
jgi:hypothetical protein